MLSRTANDTIGVAWCTSRSMAAMATMLSGKILPLALKGWLAVMIRLADS